MQAEILYTGECREHAKRSKRANNGNTDRDIPRDRGTHDQRGTCIGSEQETPILDKYKRNYTARGQGNLFERYIGNWGICWQMSKDWTLYNPKTSRKKQMRNAHRKKPNTHIQFIRTQQQSRRTSSPAQ